MAKNSVKLFSLKNPKSLKIKTRPEKNTKRCEQITLLGFWHNQVEYESLDSALWLLNQNNLTKKTSLALHITACWLSINPKQASSTLQKPD